MQCTTEQFLRDVADHQMEVIRDDGVYRHIRFKQPDTLCYYFDLVTWPGHLCYTGDMGTYVFTRLRDMFEFFRKAPDKLFQIDFRYWAEKCVAADKSDSIKKFSFDRFRDNVLQYIADREEELRPDPEDTQDVELFTQAFVELRQAVEEDVLSCDPNDVRAYDAANDFSHTDGPAWEAFFGKDSLFEFTDFWEWDHTEYTGRFLWCCFALAWGINQYDQARQTAG